jgi:hypothetical protein
MHIPKYFAIIVIIIIMKLSMKGIGARPYHVHLHSILCTLLLFPHGRSQPSSPYGSVNHNVSSHLLCPDQHTIGQIKRKLAIIQNIRLPRNVLKKLAQGQKKFPGGRKCTFCESLFRFVPGTGKQAFY